MVHIRTKMGKQSRIRSHYRTCTIWIKTSGAEWKKTFSSYIKNTLGYSACIGADNNMYLRAEKDEDGNEYYSYLVVYVDNVLSIHKDPGKVLATVNRD